MSSYDKEWYNHIKEKGICVRCKNEKALAGVTTCYICNEKDAERSRRYRELNKEKANESSKNTYRKRREKGLCGHCGKNYSGERSMCAECCLKYSTNKKRNEYVYLGLCYFCGEKVVEGKKTCQKHYDILLKSTARMNERRSRRKAEKRACM